ncbi:MAG: dihydrodipicolinate synthase family protein [Candidatus Borkfalkiaceae bacterium]|nr:dihydrodipicolinate synthase family protein [Christensenellaceae bacterium]
MKDLRGAIGVTVTPFISGESPDFKEIEKQTEILCNSDIDGIFPCSSTGEYPKISFENKIKIMETVAKVNAGRKTLIAGACSVSIDEIKAFIDKAKELKYDACLICPPYYYPLKQEEVLRFYKEVCAYAGDMRIIAYNVHFFTTEIMQDTFVKLLEIPNLVGMKDSSGNLKKISHECDLARSIRPDFIVYTGTDDCLLHALIAGCKGSMTAFGAIFPNTIKSIYKNYENGKLDKAIEIQRSILPLLRLADSLVFPDGYKLVAKAAGLKVNGVSVLSDKEKADKLYSEMQKETRNVKQ